MDFVSKLLLASRKNKSLLCVGLDTDIRRIPTHLSGAESPALEFNRSIIDATKDLVCAYKPNFAFYEAMGGAGWEVLKGTIDYVPEDIPVILDVKRGDIGNTARSYAASAFERLGADAVTLNPYMGFDSIEPFLEYSDRCSFILCLTSNPGSADFQKLVFDGKPLYIHVAEAVVRWSKHGQCGLVVGATHPDELRRVREIAPELPILIPGVGAQGGDLERTVVFGTDRRGELAIINSSRGIIYASQREDFAEAARKAAAELRDAINRFRDAEGK